MLSSSIAPLAWRTLSSLSGVLGTSSALSLAVSAGCSLDGAESQFPCRQHQVVMTRLCALQGVGRCKRAIATGSHASLRCEECHSQLRDVPTTSQAGVLALYQ